MSLFAQEVKQSSRQPMPAPKESAEAAPTKEAAAPVTDEHPLAMPTGVAPVEGPVVVVESKTRPPEEKPAPPIKIAGKEFTSIDEAIAYAEQLEIASREEKAFQDGYQKATETTKEPEPAKKTYVEEAEAKLFEDPKAAIEILREGIRAEIFKAYDTMTAQQVAQQEAVARREQTWSEFYKTNTDLADAKEYVEFVTKKHWETLANKPADKALSEIAELARKGLKLTREASLPKEELHSKGAKMAGASGDSTTVQVEATHQKNLDFIAQLASLRKRK